MSPAACPLPKWEGWGWGVPLGLGGGGGCVPAASPSAGDTGAVPAVLWGLIQPQGVSMGLRGGFFSGRPRDKPGIPPRCGRAGEVRVSPGVLACPHVCASPCACSPCHGTPPTPPGPVGGNGPDPAWGWSPWCRALPRCTDPHPPAWTRGARGTGPHRWHHRGSHGGRAWLSRPGALRWPRAAASTSPSGPEGSVPPEPCSAPPCLALGGWGGSGDGAPPLAQPRAGGWAAGAGGSRRHRQMLSRLGHMAGTWRRRELRPPEEPGSPRGMWGGWGGCCEESDAFHPPGQPQAPAPAGGERLRSRAGGAVWVLSPRAPHPSRLAGAGGVCVWGGGMPPFPWHLPPRPPPATVWHRHRRAAGDPAPPSPRTASPPPIPAAPSPGPRFPGRN